MSYFSAEWIAKAGQLYGMAPQLRFSVRPAGTGSTATVVTELEDVLDCSQIVTERERRFSLVQGQAWQITLTRLADPAAIQAAIGGWARLEVGYADVDEWATVAVGTIEDVEVSTGGTVHVEAEDALVALMSATLKRPIRFQDEAWVGEVVIVKTDEDSSGYDNNATGAGCVIVSGGADIEDEEFRIVFTSATAFKIVLPSGGDSQTGTIGTDCTFARDGGSGSIKINMGGWSTAGGAYVAGDEFSVSTARAREAFELGAVGMIRHLIGDVAGLRVYDFDTDALVVPYWDTDNWTTLITETLGDTCFGTFAKGERIIDLIEGILPLHISLYPRPNGKIGVWYMLPAVGGGRTLNGNHDGSDVHITSGAARRTMQGVCNRVVYKYRARGSGDEAVYEAAPTSTDYSDRPLEIETPWEINPLSIATACDRALVRFGEVGKPYAIDMPFIGASIDIGETVVINDAALGASMDQVGVTKIRIDPINCRAHIEAVLETITLGDYFRIAADDESSGNRIGDSGDTGAGRIY